MNLDQLKVRLRELDRAVNEQVTVALAGAATTSLQQLTLVMDACRQSGITQIEIATQDIK
jgi:biopolymer transport protein ExbD